VKSKQTKAIGPTMAAAPKRLERTRHNGAFTSLGVGFWLISNKLIPHGILVAKFDADLAMEQFDETYTRHSKP
jgi:hypothetical protein